MGTNKITIVLTYKHNPEDSEIFAEKVDTEKQGVFYRLLHVPAFAPNIAYGDIVKVDFEDGEFHFEELVEESGYSVIHIVIFDPSVKEEVISVLRDFNCGVNLNVADDYLVISVPPESEYKNISNFLKDFEASEKISFRETLSSVHASSQMYFG